LATRTTVPSGFGELVDPGYMGTYVNGRVLNVAASVYLVIILTASLAAIPLMIVTGAGQ
jgi:hypothetical protein